MRSAFNKEVTRSIKGTAGRFIAIIIISFLGAGFYAGLRMAAPDMRIAGDEFFDGTSLYDASVVCTLGLDDQSIAALKAVDGVDQVMAAYQANALATVDDTAYVTVFNSLDPEATESDTSDGVHAVSDEGGYLNRPILVEGEWPADAGQCVLGVDGARAAGVQLGQTLTLEKGEGELSDTFAKTEFTVAGFVNSPAYIAEDNLGTSSLGATELYAYVPEKAFMADVPYSIAYLTVEGARQTRWDSDGYDQAVQPVVERLRTAGQAIAKNRERTVRADAQKELNDARSTYLQERRDAEGRLTDADATLNDARTQLDDAKAQLDDARTQLDTSKAQLDASNDELHAREAEYTAGYEQLQAQRQQLQPAIDSLPALQAQRQALASQAGADPQQVAALDAQIKQIQQGAQGLAAAQAQLGQARTQLDEGWRQYNEGVTRYRAGMDEYYRGMAEYNEGQKGYDSGRAEYDQNKAKADQEFADAEADLAEAQKRIDDLDEAEVFIMDRTKNAGAASLSHDAQSITQIATFLPFLFYLVAALVVLTSMTRMVDEERLDIGTHKALGYSKGRITSKYLIYGLLAAGIGSVLGIVVLGQLLPWFIMTSYAVNYSTPLFPTPLDPLITAKALGISLGVTVLATWGAAAASLREKPAQLMLPKAPKAGRRILLERIGPLWRRLSFSHKVTARNLLRYKRRFFMAVVGIAGCTALLMVGFGLRDAIGGIVTNQYGQLITYDVQVTVDEEADDEQVDEVTAALTRDGVASSMAVAEKPMIAKGGEEDLRFSVIMPSDADRLGSFITLRDRVSGQGLAPTDDAVVISEKAARALGVKVGDEITLYDENMVGDAEGDGHRFKVGGITENYLQHYAYILPGLYTAVTGEEPVYDQYLVNLADNGDSKALSEELMALEAVDAVTHTADQIVQYEDMLAVMDKLIIVIVLLCAALAFVVLYNLININICERVREIATLKVLGFTRREVRSYIFREIIIMVLIGAVVGCVAGVPLTFYIAQAAETAAMMFGRSISLFSFAASFLITVAFAFVVAWAMGPRLARISMVESLKSIE